MLLKLGVFLLVIGILFFTTIIFEEVKKPSVVIPLALFVSAVIIFGGVFSIVLSLDDSLIYHHSNGEIFINYNGIWYVLLPTVILYGLGAFIGIKMGKRRKKSAFHTES